MKILTKTDNLTEQEWLEWRRKGIGGSDAAAACGLSKWKSRRQLFLEKTGQVEHKIMNNEAVYWGKSLEENIARRFQEDNPDIEVRVVKAILQHDEYDFMLADIDREIVTPTGNGILEVKTTSARGGEMWKDDGVPIDYLIQVQHYLAVTGYKFAWIVCLIGGRDYVTRYIERDESLIETLIASERDFWVRVETNSKPDWSGTEADEELLKSQVGEAVKGSQMELDDSFAEQCKIYMTLEQEKKKYEDSIKQIEQQLKSIKEYIAYTMGSVERATAKDFIITFPTVSVAERYVKPFSYRRFSIKAL